ncbi:MAG: FAD-binding oxidoreductase [Candidatus Doudnabacteria bacterium]|nr:FAD-binding oxidoreductase [Candidatus Doudnabacteria bacterium]
MDFEHTSKVQKIADKIKELKIKGVKPRIFRGNSNTTRHVDFVSNEIIDISCLNKILEINQEQQYIVVEPNVTMGELIKAILPFGLIPAVVMEFPDISAGGAFQGGAGESSSFKYGLFHEITEEIEIVDGSGNVLELSPKLDKEMYYLLACTYGSLAVLTKLKIKLVPATKFVKLSFFECASINQAVDFFKENLVNNKYDFADAIFFSKNKGVVIFGKMVIESSDISFENFNNASSEWFYSFVENKMKSGDLSESYLTMEDYLFRYNYGGFWIAKYFFEFLKIPINKLTKYVFKRFLYAKNLFKALHEANYSQKFLVQDFCLPAESTEKYFNYLDDHYKIYPIWLCPINASVKYDEFSPAHVKGSFAINFGSYGIVPKGVSYLDYNRDLELVSASLGGRQTLYAHNYYTKEEFWQMYDLNKYQKARKYFKASETFSDIYEKTHVSKQYKASLSRGLFSLFFKRVR